MTFSIRRPRGSSAGFEAGAWAAARVDRKSPRRGATQAARRERVGRFILVSGLIVIAGRRIASILDVVSKGDSFMSMPERLPAPYLRQAYGIPRPTTLREVRPLDLDATLPIVPRLPVPVQVLPMRCLCCQGAVEKAAARGRAGRRPRGPVARPCPGAAPPLRAGGWREGGPPGEGRARRLPPGVGRGPRLGL